MLEVTPYFCVRTPAMGGITAPPLTARITNPEISLAYAGLRSTVRANTRGKILENPSPVINIRTQVNLSDGEPRMLNRPASVTRVLVIRNIFVLTFLKRMEPSNLPAIREAKYMLIPRLAVSRLILYLFLR